jgi:hypothetical protein
MGFKVVSNDGFITDFEQSLLYVLKGHILCSSLAVGLPYRREQVKRKAFTQHAPSWKYCCGKATEVSWISCCHPFSNSRRTIAA